METLVVVAQHRNQYYGRSKSHSPDSSAISRGFRDINCRTFQSGAGILPTPFKSYNSTAIRKSCSSIQISPPISPRFKEERTLKNSGRSKSVPINVKATNKDMSFNDDFAYSELWAGPAYSNSPPPSSLPIPKFSLRQKQSVSLELPVSSPGITRHAIAKSAPPSPTRDMNLSTSNFFICTDSATKNLRRILHLDIGDE